MLHSLLAYIATTGPATTSPSFSNVDVQIATPDEVLSPYIYVFYAAFIVAYLFTPVMRQIALYYVVVDHPDSIRKMHRSPVAYLGGAAVFLGWLAALATSQFVQAHRVDQAVPHLRWPVETLLGAAMIVVLGLWDDLRKARPSIKIAIQILAALILLHGGIGAHCLKPLFLPVVARLQFSPHWNPQLYADFEPIVSGIATVLMVVGCCNATNLMDGLDGLCGGVAAIIAAGFVFLAVHMATIGQMGSANTEGMRVVLALALLGAVLGFVPFNFNPASIFLGDTGSMFIGFSFATLLVMMAESRPKWFLAGFVMFALPVLDTGLAFMRRWVNKRPIFSADRHHFHHQLLARGFSVRQTVIISYGLAICFVILGAAMVFMRTRYVVAAYMVIFGFIIVAAYKMGLVHEKEVVHSARNLTNSGSTIAGGAGLDEDSVLEVNANKSEH